MPPKAKRQKLQVKKKNPTNVDFVNDVNLDDEIKERLAENNLSLREHQKIGINRILEWESNGHGGILADEMGLGKTCQATLVMCSMLNRGHGPFLVIPPLTVVDHWVTEIERFSCGMLKPIAIIGNNNAKKTIFKKIRANLTKNSVLIAPYHILRQERNKLLKIHREHKFYAVIADEVQNAKNHKTVTYDAITLFNSAFYLLMTGTPIQNYLSELYTILSLVDSKKFSIEKLEEFEEKHGDMDEASVKELHEILNHYMLRRTKDQLPLGIPLCEEVTIYHGMCDKQKELYMNFLDRRIEEIRTATGTSFSMINLLMQLRKCVAHPYLHRGVEPKPFVEGEHIVETSGKFQMLDRILMHLKETGHRVLIFSQFKIVHNIVEDFMILRGYKYERIDGTVELESRIESVDRFMNKKEKEAPFCFLLTTRAGGLGLTLTAADTAIFMDNDWNPQNDLQAMARCHRIGQTKPVKVIRLVGRYTVEQYLQRTARTKLEFTGRIINEDYGHPPGVSLVGVMEDILKRENVETMKNAEYVKMNLTTEVLERIIGKTDENGHWLPATQRTQDGENKLVIHDNIDNVDREDVDSHEYLVYKGTCYREKHLTRITIDEDVHSMINNLQGRKKELDFSRYRGFI